MTIKYRNLFLIQARNNFPDHESAVNFQVQFDRLLSRLDLRRQLKRDLPVQTSILKSNCSVTMVTNENLGEPWINRSRSNRIRQRRRSYTVHRTYLIHLILPGEGFRRIQIDPSVLEAAIKESNLRLSVSVTEVDCPESLDDARASMRRSTHLSTGIAKRALQALKTIVYLDLADPQTA